jgi:hypothetical protein
LVNKVTGDRNPVYLWKGYGVVCPTLWTTNGYLDYAARLITDELKVGRFKVEDRSLDLAVDITDYVSLKEEFFRLYKENKCA